MAVGRLAHVSVAAGGYATVYNNSSGTPAVVSVIVGAAEDATFNLRITDASSYDFTNTITVATESYNTDDIRIDSQTSGVQNRYQFTSDTGNYTTEAKNLNFYLDSNTTSYANYGAYNATSSWEFPVRAIPAIANSSYEPVLFGSTTQISTGYSVDVSGYGGNDQYPSEESRVFRMATHRAGTDPFGNGWGTGNYNWSWSQANSNRHVAWDPWWKKAYGETIGKLFMSVDNSAFMRSYVIRLDAQNTNSRTSDSMWWNFSSGNVGAESTYAKPYPRIRMSCGVVVLDTCAEGTTGRGLYWYAFDPDVPASQIVDAAIEQSNQYRNGIAGNTNWLTSKLQGGNCIFMEYNPQDDHHYLFVRGSTSTQYMLKIKRDTFFTYTSTNYISTISNWWDPNIATAGFTLDTEGIVLLDAADWSFPTFSNAPFTNGDCTFRTYYVAENTWAMVGWNTTTGARDIAISNDLLTWQTFDAFYSPNKYEVKATNDSTVTLKHDNTKLFYTEDNFVNLGTDGILENGTQAKILERTGLMMDSGDKLIVHNSGTVPLSVQVMGYEGQE
jgi:hypothetical protein